MECKGYKQKFEEIIGWEKTSDGREAYSKLFKFADFKQAFSFMTSFPKELDLFDKIDYEVQFSKAFIEPLRFITDKINWLIDDSYGVQGSLEEFFG